MNRIAILIFTLLITSCAQHSPRQESQLGGLTEQQAYEHLEQGVSALMSGSPQKAIREYFDPVIAHYENSYKGKTVYCARSPQESLLYLIKAASENKEASVVGQEYAQAYYYKAYAYIDLGNLKESEVWLNKAIALSPHNSGYSSELAHLYQIQNDWERSIEMFKKAEEYAKSTSPQEVKDAELIRAKRGIAYSLVEQGKFDEAINIYKECLAIEPNDEKSKMELQYIEKARKSKNDKNS